MLNGIGEIVSVAECGCCVSDTRTIELAQAPAADGGLSATALFQELYRELRKLAHRQLAPAHPGGDGTLNTTALVHEAFLKLRGSDGAAVEGRGHFFALAARAMRQIIIDQARRHATEKRGGGAARTSLDENVIAIDQEADHLLALDQAISRLEALDERLAV
jgi:RNA polymerase sigma factor (TIGR02999 family)